MIRVTTSLAILAFIYAPAASAHGAPALPLAQQAAPGPIVTSEDLGDGLHMLKGRGGNIGLLTGPDGAFVIDSQYANIAPANLAKIDEIAGDAPRFLVNTHWHGDHTGGNAAFDASGALIIAHDNVRVRVSTDQSLSIGGAVRETPASDPAAWPIITFDEDMTLHVNGQTARLIHMPNAHTDGDTLVHFEQAGVLHMGDVMFSGMFPFIDISSGGSVDGYIAALDAAYDMIDDDTRVIPGHGPLSTREDIKTLADMLRDTRAAVQVEIDAGKSLDETLAAAPLTPWVEDWATAFMTEPVFTTILYEDLSAADAS